MLKIMKWLQKTADKMFYQMEKKEKSVSDLLQEGFKEEQEND